MPRLMAYSPNAFTYHETIGLLVAADFPCLQASCLTHILGHPRRTETEVGIGTKRGCWFRSFMSFLQTDFKSIVLSDIEHLKKKSAVQLCPVDDMQLPSLLFSLFNKRRCEVSRTPGFVTWLLIPIVLLCPGNVKKFTQKYYSSLLIKKQGNY